MKKTLFIHHLHSLLKQHKRIENQSELSEQSTLMQKYLRNFRQKSVKISFGDLFDEQSRYKVIPKNSIKAEQFGSNLSFNRNQIISPRSFHSSSESEENTVAI
jgi:uncharacterized protein YnzC (UPF0291/DUF896 family)